MSTEAVSGWVGGIIGFMLGSVFVGMSIGLWFESSECRRWERVSISRGLGTYNDKGQFQWIEQRKAECP